MPRRTMDSETRPWIVNTNSAARTTVEGMAEDLPLPENMTVDLVTTIVLDTMKGLDTTSELLGGSRME